MRYKLRMFGVPILEEETTNVYCDNEAVVKNNTNVDPSLSKKHSSCAYKITRWQVAAGVISLGWIHTDENLADALTKRLAGIKREYLFGN